MLILLQPSRHCVLHSIAFIRAHFFVVALSFFLSLAKSKSLNRIASHRINLMRLKWQFIPRPPDIRSIFQSGHFFGLAFELSILFRIISFALPLCLSRSISLALPLSPLDIYLYLSLSLSNGFRQVERVNRHHMYLSEPIKTKGQHRRKNTHRHTHPLRARTQTILLKTINLD